MKTKSKSLDQDQPTNPFTAWGLAAGDRAFYADSLGRLFTFLTHSVLPRVGSNQIEKALVLNFHVGLRCLDSVTFASRPNDTQKFEISLSNLNGTQPCLLSELTKKMDSQGHLRFAACSAATVAEAFHNTSKAKQDYMAWDYKLDPVTQSSFEEAVACRFRSLATAKINVEVFHTASDLPLTVVYLKFKSKISPRFPDEIGNKLNRGKAKAGIAITELLATGLYEPRYATRVAFDDENIKMPVQVLVASGEHDPLHKQIANLVNVYEEHLSQQQENPNVGAAKSKPFSHAVRIFFAYMKSDFDQAVVKGLGKKIESLCEGKVDICIVDGCGSAMSQTGKTFFEQIRLWVHETDYAIVLIPRKFPKKYKMNVPYELGLFTQRFVTRNEKGALCSQRTIVFSPSGLGNGSFSDLDGVNHASRTKNSKTTVNQEIEHIFSQLTSGESPKIPFLGALSSAISQPHRKS